MNEKSRPEYSESKCDFKNIKKDEFTFWKCIIYNEEIVIQNSLINLLANNTIDFINFYKEFPICLSIAYNINPVFIKDKINEWICYYGQFDSIYWKLLYDLLSKKILLIDCDKLVENRPFDIESMQFSDEQFWVFKTNNIFNKFLLNAYSYIFQVEYRDICNHVSDEDEALLWFKYITWDNIIIEKLDRAYTRLAQRLIYNRDLSWEKHRLKSYKNIITTYKNNIICDYMKLETDIPDLFYSIWCNI